MDGAEEQRPEGRHVTVTETGTTSGGGADLETLSRVVERDVDLNETIA